MHATSYQNGGRTTNMQPSQHTKTMLVASISEINQTAWTSLIAVMMSDRRFIQMSTTVAILNMNFGKLQTHHMVSPYLMTRTTKSSCQQDSFTPICMRIQVPGTGTRYHGPVLHKIRSYSAQFNFLFIYRYVNLYFRYFKYMPQNHYTWYSLLAKTRMHWTILKISLGPAIFTHTTFSVFIALMCALRFATYPVITQMQLIYNKQLRFKNVFGFFNFPLWPSRSKCR